MGKVKVVECIGEVMREVHFDSFEDFMEYERVNNSRVEEKKLPYSPVVAGEEWIKWEGDIVAPVECDDAHIEIVYQEYVDKKWVEKATVGAVDKVQWERLVKYGTFLINAMEDDE